MDWMDFNHDGEVDAAEFHLGEEMLCSSREEYKMLFGDDGDYVGDDYEDEDEDEEDFEDDYDEDYGDDDEQLVLTGFDRFDLEMIDEDERWEALEDAGRVEAG